VTPEGFDEKADISTMIFGRNRVPVRTASEFQGSYSEELQRYPDNFSALTVKWRLLSRLYFDHPDSLKAAVQGDLKYMLKQPDSTTAEFLFALATGHRYLGQRKQAEGAIEQLVALHADDPLAVLALQDHEQYLRETGVSDQGSTRISKQKWELMARRPQITVIRTEAFRDLGLQPTPSLQILESLCNFWISKEPLNPFPLYHLALAYETRGTNLDLALKHVDNAISLILSGMFRVFDDRGGSWEQLLLSDSYTLKARMAFKLGRFADAYASLVAAEARSAMTDPRLPMLEAQIYERLGMLEHAQSAYLRAVARQSPTAMDSLRTLYSRRTGGMNGFEQLLRDSRLSDKTASSRSDGASFRFSIQSLDGKSFNTSSLRGKVVVINFWFKGCAPCVAEMPSLNRLVADFKSKEVVFLAVNVQDSPPDIQRFLKSHPFSYNIVAGDTTLQAHFDVKVFPTHIVLDRKGRLVQKLVGGDTKRDRALAPIIRSLLRQ
jgi:thiol-disulfide isomerase/thioredoxin